jgi:preprotein translocase subunit YajC
MTTLLSLTSAPLLLATKDKKSGSSELPLILIIGLFAVVYFFFLRPRQQRAREKATKGKSFEIGDEVMSVGGIYGRIVGLGDESVDVEVAPDIVLTFLRRAVNARPASATSSGPPSPDDRYQGSDEFGGSGDGRGSDHPGSSTSFGASSGHFDDSDRFDDSGHFDDHDHGDLEDDEGYDDLEEDAGSEADDELDDGEDEGEPGAGGEDGSATGKPRTTGGSSSEED